MRRVRNHPSSVLGGARGVSGPRVDVSLARELGFGAHTLTIGAFSTSATGPSQPAGIYCTEDAIWIVLISHVRRSNVQEEKISMRFAHVIDIQVQRLVEGALPPVFPHPEEEQRRQRVLVTLNCAQTPMTVFIDTHDSPLFAKHVLCAWQSFKLFTNSRAGRLQNCADGSLAQDYMNEISQDLRETKTSDLARYAEIFDELALEVRNDLVLKEALFKSCEVVVQTLVILQSMLDSPTGLERQVAARIKFVVSQSQPPSPQKSPTTRGGGPSAFSFEPASASAAASKNAAAELTSRLHEIIEKRLVVVKAGLTFLTSLFVCSESISCRTNILVGPPPLDIDSWFTLLVPDLFSGMMDKFGGASLEPKSDIDSELAEFNRSLFIARANPAESGEASSGAERKSLAEAILTPMRKKDASTHLGPRLVSMRQSVAEQQLVLLFEICRVGSMEYRQKTPGLSRVDLYGPQSAMAPIGETYERIDDWEGCLERTVMRLSGLLDDMFTRNSETERSSVPPAKPPRRQTPAGVNPNASSSAPPSPSKSSAETVQQLFCACYVVRSLAWDSPKIREALAGDLLSLFLPILSVYNLLCPRGTSPPPPLPPPTTEYGSASAAPPAPGLMNCFQTRKAAKSEEQGVNAGGTNPLNLGLDDDLFPRIPVSAYGPSQISGLSKSSWLLLVLSRRCVEDTLNSLHLLGNPVFVRAAQMRDNSVTPRLPSISRSAAKKGPVNPDEETTNKRLSATNKPALGLSVVTDNYDDTENMVLQSESDTLPSESDSEHARLLQPKHSATPVFLRRP